jgi:hypothetical protein
MSDVTKPDADGMFQMPLAPEGEPPTDVWLRPLSGREFALLLQQGLASLAGPEGAEMAALRAWFVRKYPTPEARLAYVRRKQAELAQPSASKK